MEENKKTKYTEAQKKAILKYRINNKDKINAQRKAYYEKRKNSDPTFLEYKRNKAREYYQRKKDIKKPKLEEVKEIEYTIIKPATEVIEHPIIDETKPEKNKRKYTKKNNNN